MLMINHSRKQQLKCTLCSSLLAFQSWPQCLCIVLSTLDTTVQQQYSLSNSNTHCPTAILTSSLFVRV
jgi:hypothetical protein